MSDSNRSDGTTVDFNPAPATAAGTGDVTFTPASDIATTSANNATTDEAAPARGTAQTLKAEASKLGRQATDQARGLVGEGKAKATGALDEFSRLMDDAAGTVDEKLGEQYGQYARSAAQGIQTLSDSIRDKEVDELIEDVRGFVRKSPAVAIGTAAALGFILARVVKAGIDASDNANGASTPSTNA